MFAVRNIFAKPERLREVCVDLVAAGELPPDFAGKDNPLDFLIHEAGARTLTEAAYRFARYEPGVHAVLFGTGNPEHVRSNVAAALKPPLPARDQEAIRTLFGKLVGVGLEKPPRRPAADQAAAPA